MSTTNHGHKTRCIIVGAGFSGILIAIKLQESLKDKVDFWIFEKNADIGGTWFENKYPGCACDVPSHIYQYSFCPNPYWSSFYASSAEIQSYLRAVVCHHGIDQHISFRSSVTSAIWHADSSTWSVEVEGRGTFGCNILINACGILNNIQYPRIPHLERFKGPVLHTAAWDSSVDLRGKRVAVVGAGASSIQMLPVTQKAAQHIDVYIRTPSWITPSIGETEEWDRSHNFTAEEKERFRDDKSYSLRTRKQMEEVFNNQYRAFLKDSDEQRELRQVLETSMKQHISDPALHKNLIPDFEVGCRRINPGEPYLHALQQQNVHPVFDSIEEATEDGIVAGGKHRLVDVIIAATGFNTSFRPRFPIIGRESVNLQDLWKDDPIAYFGLAVAGFPNYLMFLGPNTPISNGSLVGTLEATVEYFIRLITKFIKEKAQTFEVSAEVQADFDSHTQEVMKKMVWTGSCRSWYKGENGKIRALWPGSMLHYREILASNRWEDFHWQYSSNRFSYWGTGFSDVELNNLDGKNDLAYYLEEHEPLPLEAFYAASQGCKKDAQISEVFSCRRPDQKVEKHCEANSEASSPVLLTPPQMGHAVEAAAISI